MALGDAKKAKRWVDHWRTIYPDEADYIIKWLACRGQRPGVKINHALLLGSEEQGVGKDTLLHGRPARRLVPAISRWSSPSGCSANIPTSSVRDLQISEIKDTSTGDGERVDRFALYDRVKDLIAAPPPVLHYVDKYQRGYDVTNCVGVVMTSNHELGSIYIPDADRRLFVAGRPSTARARSPTSIGKNSGTGTSLKAASATSRPICTRSTSPTSTPRPGRRRPTRGDGWCRQTSRSKRMSSPTPSTRSKSPTRSSSRSWSRATSTWNG